MRVIAGKARRIPLVTVKGMETRPTTDRTKESLFNMIAHGLCDCTFLDLFSGSGAIGIEKRRFLWKTIRMQSSALWRI